MGKKRKRKPDASGELPDVFRNSQEEPFFKKPEGLGEGKDLGQARSRMESALGEDLSDVRIHTDANAHTLNRKQNADAVTVGQDIAFGPGKYKPGTLAGDALLAHELAHTIQQKDANPISSPASERSTGLEKDANNTAAGVLGRLFGRKSGPKPKPGRKAGFSMQMSLCSSDNLVDPERPSYFGPESHQTMDNIEAIDESWNMVSGLTLGGTLIILATSSPAENLASGSYDVEPQARALAVIPQIKIAQIQQQIEFLLLEDATRHHLSQEEKQFWQRLHDRLSEL